MTTRAVLFIVAIASLCIGCSSTPPPVEIHVTSDPGGSSVFFDGKNVGTTPCRIEVKKDDEVHYLRVSKKGYHKVIKEIRDGLYPEKVEINLIPKAESGESPKRNISRESGSSETW